MATETFEFPNGTNGAFKTRVVLTDGAQGKVDYVISFVRINSAYNTYNLNNLTSASAPDLNVNILGTPVRVRYNFDWMQTTSVTYSVSRNSTIFTPSTSQQSSDLRVGMTSGTSNPFTIVIGTEITEKLADGRIRINNRATNGSTSSTARYTRPDPHPTGVIEITRGTVDLAAGTLGNLSGTNDSKSTAGIATLSGSFRSAPPPIPAPVFTTGASLPDARRDSFYSTTINASDATSYSLVANSFPTGISLSGNTISGTPTQAGISSISYSFTIRASNSTGSVDKEFTIIVVPPAPNFSDQSITTTWIKTLNFSSAPDRTVAASDTSSFSVFASGSGTNPTAWLSINNSGQLSGLPAAVGVYTFIVRASGDGGTTDTSLITLTINPPGNRSTGTGVATDLTVTKRFDGSSWVNVNTFKRFDGNGWVDITN